MMREATKAMHGSSSSSPQQVSQTRATKSSAAATAAASSSSSRQQPQQSVASPPSAMDIDKYTDLMAPLVDRSGGITEPTNAAALAAALPKFGGLTGHDLVCRVLSRSSPAALAEFMKAAGAVDSLAEWMLAAMGEDSEAANNFLLEALAALRRLPVTRAFVQATKSAKVVGALRKHDSVEVRKQAKAVVQLWMKVMPSSSGGGR